MTTDDFHAQLAAAYRPLRRYLRRYAAPGTDEDVVHDTMVQALRALQSQRSIRYLEGWLRTAGKRLIYRQYRAQKLRPISLDHLTATVTENEPSALLQDRERLAAFRSAYGQLSLNDQHLLERYYVHGAGTAELAGELYTSREAIKNRLQRTLARLKELVLSMEEAHD